MPSVLVTGATGFVGKHLCPALERAGWDVICSSRNPRRAERSAPQYRWVRLDVEDPISVSNAMHGVDAAVYLVHGMHGGGDYPERECEAARAFRDSAESAGLERVVYLGGVAPEGKTSRHLQSRIDTGELLRSGKVPTVELRAAMVIGAGSASWTIVRDLAARLPAMVLPRWLRNRSCPIGIDDVVAALVASLDADAVPPGCYDLPGTECVSHVEALERAARSMGTRPAKLHVPVLTPRLSAYWIALVTRTELELALELVEGLQSDLLPREDADFWKLVPDITRTSLDEAIRRALAEERGTSFSDSLVPSAREGSRA